MLRFHKGFSGMRAEVLADADLQLATPISQAQFRSLSRPYPVYAKAMPDKPDRESHANPYVTCSFPLQNMCLNEHRKKVLALLEKSTKVLICVN